jgi:hypothetical protein
MRIYPIRTILNLAECQDIIPYPFLNAFAREYAKAVTEDKDAPLFSRTNKYSSFPVRCQWKGSGSSNQQGDATGFTFSRRNGKREVSKKTRVARMVSEPPLEWRRTGSEDETPSMAVTKIQKLEGLQGGITRVLNKITNDNFDVQTSDLLKLLKESEDPETVKTLAELILEKVWYDKSFYNLYVSLCKKLWSNTEWNKNAYNVFKMDTPQGVQYFYSTFFQNSCSKKAQDLQGPFKRSEEAHHEAQAKIHLRSIFLALCRDYFHQREVFIKESQGLPDSTRRYKLRRKLFGTVEILGQFFVMGLLSENIIHYLLLTLLNKGKGARYAEELEAFQLLWNIVRSNLSPGSCNEYIEFLERERAGEWNSRIGFMIQDVLESIPSYRGPKKKKVIPPPEPDTPKIEKCKTEPTTDLLVDKIVQQSRAVGPVHKNALENFYAQKTKLDSAKAFRCLAVKLATGLIRDSTEYGEYMERHLDTLLTMLHDTAKSGLTFTELSESFSEAGEDIAELKLDAPKAPHNMSRILVRILTDTQKEPFDTEVLQISISRMSDTTQNEQEDIDFQEYEECQRREWQSIIKMAGKELSSVERVHLFSLNSN